MSRTTPTIAILLIALAFAGCIGSGDETGPDVTDGIEQDCVGDGFCGQAAVIDLDTGRDLRTDLTIDDALDAPEWDVGDVFEQHMFFGADDDTGEHIQTMVVEDQGNCNYIATSSQQAAKDEAVYDHPILGCIGKANLETEAYGITWDWMYDFPISEGKSWDATITGLINFNDFSFNTYEVTFTATYNEAINTWTGDFPGFEIEGVTADGDVLARYNYVPAVGWFSHFWLYDLNTEDTEDIMFHAMSMGTSKGYNGVYYIDENRELVNHFVTNLHPIVPGSDPPVPTQFEMHDTETYLVGIVVPIVAQGAAKVVVTTPANEARQYDAIDDQPCPEIVTDPNAPCGSFGVYFIDEEATAGAWSESTTGAGFFWASYVWLNALTETEYTLTSAEPESATAEIA